jgi:hypothetical protein
MMATKIIEALQQAIAANAGKDGDVMVFDVAEGDNPEEDARPIEGVRIIAQMNDNAEVYDFGIYLVFE